MFFGNSDTAEEITEDVRDSARRLKEDVKEGVADLKQQGRAKMADLGDQAKEKVGEAKEGARELADNVRSAFNREVPGDIRSQLADLGEQASDLKVYIQDEISHAMETARYQTSRAVREQPVLSLLAAAGIMLMIGCFAKKRM